jgi:hypothetical protein
VRECQKSRIAEGQLETFREAEFGAPGMPLGFSNDGRWVMHPDREGYHLEAWFKLALDANLKRIFVISGCRREGTMGPLSMTRITTATADSGR